MGEALLVVGGKVASSEEFHRGEVVLERIVDGEHQVVEAQHRSGAVEHGHVEYPAAGDEHIPSQVVADVVADCLVARFRCEQPDGNRQTYVEAGKAVGQQFTYVSVHDLQIRMTVEDTGTDELEYL